MGNNTVSLHLSEPQSSSPTPPVSGLPGDGNDRASWSSIHLVIHQVSQPLIKDRANENQVLQLLATVRIEHHLIAVLLVPKTMHLLSFHLHVERPERCSILAESAFQGCHFSHQCLDDVPNGHSGRDAMRVDDHIGHYSVHCEGQVFLSESHAASTLLAMSGCKLVPNLGYPYTSDSYLRKLVTSCVLRDDDQVDDSFLGPSGPE